MKTGIPTNGSTVKNHISLKTGFGYNAISRLVNEFYLQFLSFNFNDTFKKGEALFYIFFKLVFFTNDRTSSDNETREREDRTESDTSPVPVSSSHVDDITGKPVVGRESNHEPVHQANQNFPKTT